MTSLKVVILSKVTQIQVLGKKTVILFEIEVSKKNLSSFLSWSVNY